MRVNALSRRRLPVGDRRATPIPLLPERIGHGTLVRKHCRQLFFVFAGSGGQIMMDPSAFLRASGLLRRNLVLLRDAAQARYRYSRDVADLLRLVEWQRKELAELDHVTEVHCLGASLAGYSALVSGHLLCADGVWAFAPPTALAAPDVRPEYRDLALLLATWNGKTRYHVFYNERCRPDREAARRLAGCPGMELHPEDGNDHLVVRSLVESGRLVRVLPPYAAASGPAAPPATELRHD